MGDFPKEILTTTQLIIEGNTLESLSLVALVFFVKRSQFFYKESTRNKSDTSETKTYFSQPNEIKSDASNKIIETNLSLIELLVKKDFRQVLSITSNELTNIGEKPIFSNVFIGSIVILFENGYLNESIIALFDSLESDNHGPLKKNQLWQEAVDYMLTSSIHEELIEKCKRDIKAFKYVVSLNKMLCALSASIGNEKIDLQNISDIFKEFMTINSEYIKLHEFFVEKNIFFVQGFMELAMCSVLVKQHKLEDDNNVLVFYGPEGSIPKTLADEMRIKYKTFGKWQEYVELLHEDCLNITFDPQDYRSQKLLKFNNQLNTKNIFISKLHGLLEQHFAWVLHASEVVLYDNGLISHFDRNITHEIFKQGSAPKWLINRVYKSYYLLANKLPIPNYLNGKILNQTNLEDFKILGNRISELCEVFPTLKEVDYELCLVLGSSFARTNLISREDEEGCYERLIQKLKKKGFRVIFKDHHRSPYEYLMNSFNAYTLRSDFPAELLLQGYNIKHVFSISTTALFTFQILFPGCKAWHIDTNDALSKNEVVSFCIHNTENADKFFKIT